MAILLRDHPKLRAFHLQNVRVTGRKIGSGAYGSVEEAEFPGSTCAIKKIHDIFQDRSEIPEDEIQKAAGQFIQECRLMSTLRHPHIVQFLGICTLPGSRLPALVMERLLTSLHDLLETRPNIPLGLKRSFLYDTARGLTYLHTRSPPLIHRDLSARNVLLNSAMTAKISAELRPELCRYRSELERRGEYMQLIYGQLRHDHPLVEMIQQCLKSYPEDRPKIQQVVHLLERAGAEIDDTECRMDRLALIEIVKEQSEQIESNELHVLSKNQHIRAMELEMERLKQQIHTQEQSSLHENKSKEAKLLFQEQQIRKHEEELLQMHHQIETMKKEHLTKVLELRECIQYQQTQIQQLRKKAMVSHIR